MMWIVGKNIEVAVSGVVWEFQGVYDSEDGAKAACAGHSDYWIGPAALNHLLADESFAWPGCYYPSACDEIPAGV